jgi:predicted dinucleotide-binding enzyme
MSSRPGVARESPDLASPSRPVLAICGGGNAGHALAVAISQGFAGEIVWLTSSEEKAELLRRGVFSQPGLRSTGVIVAAADKVVAISSEPAAIIPLADIVIIAVPAFAHAPILRQVSPYLKDDVLVGALPTRSGFEFEACSIISGIEQQGRRILFGLQTLPWSTQVQEPGRVVNFGALKAKVLMATLPARHAVSVAKHLTQLLGTEIVPTQNFLNMTLGNTGQVIHPGLMYGHFATWCGQQYGETEIPYFYAHASDRIGSFVEQLSADIVAVANVIEARSAGALDLSGVLSVHEWLRMSYPTQTADMRSAATCFRTGPIQARKAPMLEIAPGQFVPNFKYRYLSEDVPFGLVVVRAIAELADIETPAIDTVLRWTQEKLGTQYLTNGKLNRPDVESLPIPQNYGITTLTDLVDCYAERRPVISDLQHARS